MSPPPSPHPRISVVVTCFNYAHYVAGAIESALSQSYPNKEVVVVNDGSTDDSLRVIERYSPRITIIDQPNQGSVAAYNHGFAATSGDLVIFLDADDLLATGGTSAAAAALVRKLGANILEAAFLIELKFLNGRDRLSGFPVRSLIVY